MSDSRISKWGDCHDAATLEMAIEGKPSHLSDNIGNQRAFQHDDFVLEPQFSPLHPGKLELVATGVGRQRMDRRVKILMRIAQQGQPLMDFLFCKGASHGPPDGSSILDSVGRFLACAGETGKRIGDLIIFSMTEETRGWTLDTHSLSKPSGLGWNG
jgi:hypothetical protein